MKDMIVGALIGVLITFGTVFLLGGHVAQQDDKVRGPGREPVLIPIQIPKQAVPNELAPSDELAESGDPSVAPIALVSAPSLATASQIGLGVMPALGGPALTRTKKLPQGRDVAATNAVPVHRPRPKYPSAAKKSQASGAVVVRMHIDRGGRVTRASVVRSTPKGIFDSAALSAARKYQFRPATKSGEPVESVVEQTIRFQGRPK